MKLILLSGGVESTALMTLAKPEDIALAIQPTFGNELTTYRSTTVEQIAKHYGVKLVYAKMQVPDMSPQTFVHQMAVFLSIANVFVARHPRVTQVLCGRNSAEPADNIKDFIERHMTAWDILHPTVPFLHPLDHLSKAEQWALIPNEVRGLVSSCIHHSFCGTCYKCKEWLCLSESSL